MNSRSHIRDPKCTLSLTSWASGPIPKRAFPLFRDKSAISAQWQWRSAVLAGTKANYRLLVQMRMDKPNYKAWLAVQLGDDWAVIARLEWHHNHGSLHCHMQCAHQGIAVNEISPPGGVSVPHWSDYHRSRNKIESLSDGWQLALKFFRAQDAAEVGELGI